MLPAERIAAIIVLSLLLAGAKTPEPTRQARSVADAIVGSEQ